MTTWATKPIGWYIAALQDPSSRTRRQAAAALEVLNDRRAVEPLITALDDEDGDVRANVARTLGKIGASDTRVVDPLIAMLRSGDVGDRVMAAEALWRLRAPQAITPLAALLRDDDATVRYIAASALIRPYRRSGATPLTTPGGQHADVYRQAYEMLRTPPPTNPALTLGP